jgi:hypothetical protein
MKAAPVLNVATSILGVAAVVAGVALLSLYGHSPMAGPALAFVIIGRGLHLWRLP